MTASMHPNTPLKMHALTSRCPPPPPPSSPPLLLQGDAYLASTGCIPHSSADTQEDALRVARLAIALHEYCERCGGGARTFFGR